MRWGLCSFACVTLAFAGAGCGDSDPRALDPVASAADRTLDKQTGRFVTRIAGPYAWIVPGGSGSFSVPDEAMAVKMSCCPDAGDAPTVLDYRMLYPVAYAGYEGFEDGVFEPSVSSWTKVDLELTLEKQLSSLEPAFQAVISHSPVDGLALLRGSKDAKKIGAETVDGMRTTHYGVTVDADEAFARATSKEQRALQLTKLQDRNAVPREIDVWVSRDGLVHLIRQKLANGLLLRTTFSQLGSKVEVKAPPAADID